MLGDIKYQPIAVAIPSANAQVTVEAETDKLYSRCTGIYVSVPNDAVLTSTFSRFEINSKEIFPDGYEIKMVNTTGDVPIDDRYYEMDEPAKGSKVKTKYNDSGLASAYPYTVIIYLRLQNK